MADLPLGRTRYHVDSLKGKMTRLQKGRDGILHFRTLTPVSFSGHKKYLMAMRMIQSHLIPQARHLVIATSPNSPPKLDLMTQRRQEHSWAKQGNNTHMQTPISTQRQKAHEAIKATSRIASRWVPSQHLGIAVRPNLEDIIIPHLQRYKHRSLLRQPCTHRSWEQAGHLLQAMLGIGRVPKRIQLLIPPTIIEVPLVALFLLVIYFQHQ